MLALGTESSCADYPLASHKPSVRESALVHLMDLPPDVARMLASEALGDEPDALFRKELETYTRD